MGEEINLAPPGMQTVPLLILQKPCTEFKGLTPVFSSSAADSATWNQRGIVTYSPLGRLTINSLKKLRG
jgi:hypothetical protein